jgi:SAM-dependent methyltransferase
VPRQDAARWNSRYQQDSRASFEQPRRFLVENAARLPRQGLALDAAMGLGGNAAFLLARGLRVVGVDISIVALRQAKARLPGLMAVLADLTRFYLPANCFDVIINFYYLQRDLWPAYIRALRPGGILLIETLTEEMRAVHPEISPAYLLQPGELRQAFSSDLYRNCLELLAYHESWQEQEGRHPRAVASLAARKLHPSNPELPSTSV